MKTSRRPGSGPTTTDGIGASAVQRALETVAEKPMFKNAFTSRRAILPMSGYFEWTGERGDKTLTTSWPAVHFSPRPALVAKWWLEDCDGIDRGAHRPRNLDPDPT